jgi:hypothetical protein
VALEGVTTIYKPAEGDVRRAMINFLGEHSMAPADIDIVLVGKSGDAGNDSETDKIIAGTFLSSTVALFKHLTGEFPTAAAIAMALATRIIQGQHIPEIMMERNLQRPPKHVLIYNPYFGSHHSIILLRAC